MNWKKASGRKIGTFLQHHLPRHIGISFIAAYSIGTNLITGIGGNINCDPTTGWAHSSCFPELKTSYTVILSPNQVRTYFKVIKSTAIWSICFLHRIRIKGAGGKTEAPKYYHWPKECADKGDGSEDTIEKTGCTEENQTSCEISILHQFEESPSTNTENQITTNENGPEETNNQEQREVENQEIDQHVEVEIEEQEDELIPQVAEETLQEIGENADETPTTTMNLRRPEERRPPIWTKDYYMYMANEEFSMETTQENESSLWDEAIQAEIKAHLKNGTWEIRKRPADRNVPGRRAKRRIHKRSSSCGRARPGNNIKCSNFERHFVSLGDPQSLLDTFGPHLGQKLKFGHLHQPRTCYHPWNQAQDKISLSCQANPFERANRNV
ncbi:unnamed protein product [Nesidiocoris tenuis]|uniref:Uncharacterized protein n=1 Tax=Nesidiocoris tenuis TaxID=355587 RepID=A0A6H5HDE4_9HEMI|nr:unnamed protein product [Nesidiocoris tenuis]